jgi:hypothetical protein
VAAVAAQLQLEIRLDLAKMAVQVVALREMPHCPREVHMDLELLAKVEMVHLFSIP